MVNYRYEIIIIICTCATIIITLQLFVENNIEQIPIQINHKVVNWFQNGVEQQETALVTNTKQIGTFNILYLSNGLNINQTNSSIIAGQSVLIRYVDLVPLCGMEFKFINGTVLNNTIENSLLTNHYKFINSTDCGIKDRIVITGWHLN